MKFKVDVIGGLSHADGELHRVLVTLKGEDDSSHSVWVEYPHGHISNLTIAQIEKAAIDKARENFSNC
ncbi:hypothetical protein [Erwinia sp. Leaf53]|uniref:hypothetical protein n=1 Tax=Erwinia sp. Leaf53 TaxID=1736225 RepID=UPI0012E1F450|nr:hypothetical protein [Erwinia sp. Leaf53]